MNKRNTKRGFTITELVIVIVVIAILAAVLIPTFASLIKKANQSADVQLAKNLNTALVMDEAANGKPETFGEALDAMREAGYLLAYMNPTTEGCYLAWEKDSNQVLLIELTKSGDKYKVIFKAKDYEGEPDDSWYFAVKDQAAADAIKAALGDEVQIETTILDTTALNTQINGDGNKTVYIDGSIVADDKNVVELTNPNANTTIDLGSNSVAGGSTNVALEAIPFSVKAGTLNLKNGTIGAIGAFIDSDGKTMNAAVKATGGSVMNLEGTTIALDKAASSLVVYTGADGMLKDVTVKAITSNNAVNVSGEDSEVVLENCNIDCDYIAVQSTYGAKVTIKSGTYHTKVSNLLCVNAKAASIVVEDGTFSCDNAAKTFKFYNYTGNKLVLKGGTFNGVAFANLTEDAIRGMCNLSDCAKGINVVKTNGAWEITVK